MGLDKEEIDNEVLSTLGKKKKKRKYSSNIYSKYRR
jgi:hypothetical protein